VEVASVNSEESWQKLTSVLQHLVTVTTLHVASCHMSVVHAIADQMSWLRHFSAENIDDDTSEHSYRLHSLCCFSVLVSQMK